MTFGIEVWNYPPYAFTWGDLQHLVGALKYMDDGTLCEFEWEIGSEIRVGRGIISKN